MTTGTQQRSSSQNSQQGQSGYTTLETQGVGLDPSQIKALLFSDGYHQVSQCELVQFAIGIAHSPISPVQTYPSLRFMDESTGAWSIAPLNQIQAYSTESVSGISTRNTGI